MVEFFNKKYYHAYKRHGKVWIAGTVDGHKFHRMSTGKNFTRANMNRAEKNWSFTMKEKFEKKLNQIERSKVQTLEEFIPRSLELNEDSADPHTIKSYDGILNNHIIPVLGHYKIDEITAPVIRDWQRVLRTKKMLSQKTIINIRAALSGVFRNAIEEGIASTNPISTTRPPSKKQFIRYSEEGKVTDLKGQEIVEKLDPFNLDEINLLISNSTGQFKNIITLLFFTGMRPGEMVTLRWGDIDWINLTIHVQRGRKRDCSIGTTKNSKSRKVDVLPPVKKALIEQFKRTGMKDGFIFLNQYGDRYQDYNVLRNYHWRNLLKRSGFDYRAFYQTKHSFASMMLQAGEDIAWVSLKMLGHSEIATTLKYYAKYVKQKDERHASFLYDERTNNVQSNDVNA